MKRKIAGMLSFPALLLLLATSVPPPATLSQPLPAGPPAAPLSAGRPAPPAAPSAPLAPPLYHLSDPNVADAPYGSTPTVDGRIAPGEYTGAHKLVFPGYGGDMEVFIRQDAITLYVALDSPDTTPYPYSSGGGTGPAFQVFLDTNLDRASTPQNDDYRLTLRKNNTTMEGRGDGSGWGGAGTGQWTGKAQTTAWGWQGEFAIKLTKLGITSSPSNKVIGFALAEVWTPAWPHDWYWPLQPQAHYANPSSWGDLVSSSNWSNFYWKPGPWEDYAPSGLPDFDQRQDAWSVPSPGGPVWTHCGPVAMANSLWWFDSRMETPDHPPLTISDTYRLVVGYGNQDDHDPNNVQPLVNDLASNYFGTNKGILGTNVVSMALGMQDYLRNHALWDDYIVTLVNKPEISWIADEVKRSEDVILLLGFWQWQEVAAGKWEWVRLGGHYVTVAGVDKQGGYVGFSDPWFDRIEKSWPYAGMSPVPPNIPWYLGRVANGLPIVHVHPPGPPDPTHNDAGNVSHDVYTVVATPSPGGNWGPWKYAFSWGDIENFWGQNGGNTGDYVTGAEIQTEAEWAVAVSPVADVTIAKKVTPGTVENGDWITFTLAFTNAGSLPAEGIVVSDLLPAQLTNTDWDYWVSNGGTVTARAGPFYSWNVPDLAWREWGVITVTGQISADTSGSALVVTNNASIATSSPEQYQVPPLPNNASATFNIVRLGLDLQPSTANQVGSQNTTVTYTLILYNTGNWTDTYNIAGTVSLLSWTTQWPATVGPVGGSSSAQFNVTVQIPVGTATNAKSQAVITATSQTDPTLHDTSVLTTTATTQSIVRGVTVSPHAAWRGSDPGDVVTYTLQVKNTGNFPDVTTLSYTGPATYTVTFSANPLSLASGQGTNVQVYVTIPAGAHAGSTSLVTITATSQGNGTAHDHATLTTRVSWNYIYVPLLFRHYHN